MAILHEDVVIPAAIFRPATMNGHRNSRYTTTAACLHVLTTAKKILGGISTYQLGRILGGTDPSMVYHWFSGASRPSSLCLLRLIQIMYAAMAGVPVYHISKIDWEQSKVYWKDGRITSGSNLFVKERPVSSPGMPFDRKMAELPPE